MLFIYQEKNTQILALYGTDNNWLQFLQDFPCKTFACMPTRFNKMTSQTLETRKVIYALHHFCFQLNRPHA